MSVPWAILNSAQRRAIRDGLVLGGLLYLAWRFVVIGPQEGTVGGDALAYWALDAEHPYALPNGTFGAFLYPPPMVRAFAPASILSWPQFWLMWMSIQVATVLWLGWRRSLVVLALPFVALELYFANVNLLLGAAIVLGFRYPATWAFVLLTKVTPGVGLLWFAVRREWRQLAIALGVTAVIVAVSVVVDGRLWGEWFGALSRDSAANLGGPLASPLWLRLPIAAILVIWGARTDRPWTVLAAATIALPVVWLAALSVLAGIAAMDRPELRPSPSATPRVA